MERLRIGDERRAVLDFLAEEMERIWSGFDRAREKEPEVTKALKEMLSASLPAAPSEIIKVLGESIEALEASIAQSRPRFLAYIGSSGLEVGAIADFLASSYDINQAIDSKASTMLEQQTANWVAEFIGYGKAIGYFTSGGMVSNLTALASARSIALPNSRKTGIDKPVSIYASTESHYSISRAIEVLGIGTEALRLIPIDDRHRMIPEALENQVVADLASGVIPIAIVATAGTTLTGAIDPIDQIALIASKHGIWLHVDGAYGIPAAGTNRSLLFSGIEKADSVTIDAHKWLFVPKSCSLVLMKDCENLARTFSHHEAYMPHVEDNYNPVDLTLEYSRPLRALKLWIAFKTHGAEAFQHAIERNIELATLTYEIAYKRSDFKTLPHPPQLSIVPIQYQPKDIKEADRVSVSELNNRLCQLILSDGRFYISSAQIDGETWLRPCYTNFRTTEADVRALFAVIDELARGGSP
jgi:aromatic-L-amino-acid decarboxylase